MTRRSFLAGGAAFGGLVASARLPAFADGPVLSSERGKSERLTISCHHIEAGASKPFSVLHISDTHLTAVYPDENEWTRKFMANRSKTFGGRQEEALRDSLAWAKEHVDYVMHTGDLIDAQSRANLDLVRGAHLATTNSTTDKKTKRKRERPTREKCCRRRTRSTSRFLPQS